MGLEGIADKCKRERCPGCGTVGRIHVLVDITERGILYIQCNACGHFERCSFDEVMKGDAPAAYKKLQEVMK
jgi:transcription elongation factor Elf1